MKFKPSLAAIAIILFEVVLLLGIYFNALNKRYTVLDSNDLLVMDNWTKKTYLLYAPINLREPPTPVKNYDNLKVLYLTLKANPNIKGLPDTFEEFKSKLLE